MFLFDMDFFFWCLEVSEGLLPSEHFDIPSLFYQKDPSVSKMLATITPRNGERFLQATGMDSCKGKDHADITFTD